MLDGVRAVLAHWGFRLRVSWLQLQMEDRATCPVCRGAKDALAASCADPVCSAEIDRLENSPM